MWKKILSFSPPLNTLINTKIDDEKGVRNEQPLKFDGKLWWTLDKSATYIYYQPTHWDFI